MPEAIALLSAYSGSATGDSGRETWIPNGPITALALPVPVEALVLFAQAESAEPNPARPIAAPPVRPRKSRLVVPPCPVRRSLGCRICSSWFCGWVRQPTGWAAPYGGSSHRRLEVAQGRQALRLVVDLGGRDGRADQVVEMLEAVLPRPDHARLVQVGAESVLHAQAELDVLVLHELVQADVQPAGGAVAETRVLGCAQRLPVRRGAAVVDRVVAPDVDLVWIEVPGHAGEGEDIGPRLARILGQPRHRPDGALVEPLAPHLGRLVADGAAGDGD